MSTDAKPEFPVEPTQPAQPPPISTRQELSDEVQLQLFAALRELMRVLAQTAHAVHDRHTIPKADLGNRLARVADLIERSLGGCFGEITHAVRTLTPHAPGPEEGTNLRLVHCIGQAVDVLNDIDQIFDDAARTHRMSVPCELLSYTGAAKTAFGETRKIFEQMKTAPWSKEAS